MTTMASPSRPAAFSRILWVTTWCMSVDLAHARSRHVEVVAAQEVLGEVDGPCRPGDGLSHGRAAPGALRIGMQHPRTGAADEGHFVTRAGRMPEGGHLANAEDAALPEEAGR